LGGHQADLGAALRIVGRLANPHPKIHFVAEAVPRKLCEKFQRAPINCAARLHRVGATRPTYTYPDQLRHSAPTMEQSSARHVRSRLRKRGGLRAAEFVMIKRIAAIVLVVTCAALIISFVPQVSAIEKAFANARTVPTDDSAVNQPRAQRSCSDLEYWFLNPTCSKVRAKRTGRTSHRVATFVRGHLADAR
jgi:hypothetical protein